MVNAKKPATAMKKSVKPSRSPAAVAAQLSVRVKRLRAQRGWSLETLSQRCGVSRAMLSQIERGQANPTLAVTMAIAHAFELSIGELVQSPGSASSMEVIRAADRAFHFRSERNCRVRTLSPLHLEKDVEFYEVRLGRGGALRSEAHYTGTREFLTVQSGRVRVESGEDAEVLAAGDSVTYRADVAHAIVNAGEGEAVMFLVDIYH
ncbi:MAG: helix-turn-helix domain-containing protein [Bryobacterales bacterium]|nr:helix-turn-helix domain-containing protein [Bryobacterales bacterium]